MCLQYYLISYDIDHFVNGNDNNIIIKIQYFHKYQGIIYTMTIIITKYTSFEFQDSSVSKETILYHSIAF